MNTSALRATGVLASLGATIPVIAAPLAGGPSTPQLVHAAAEAGGLGFLAAGYLTTDALAERIARTRLLTPRFGVNLFAPNPVPIDSESYATYAAALQEVAAAHGLDTAAAPLREDDDEWAGKIELLLTAPVPVVSFTFGIVEARIVQALKRAGSVTAQSVTTLDEARAALSAGVDVLVVQSPLAGGHSATTTPGIPAEPVPLPELVRRIRTDTGAPIWATGGVSRAEQVREVLTAGAEAVAVGTVLLRTPESGASAAYKAALADPRRVETIVTRSFSGRPARALRNRFTDRFDDGAPAGYPALHHLTSPLRKASAAAGDPEYVNLWAGVGWRDATEEPAARILRRLAS
jgi:nitronate monooxygenase